MNVPETEAPISEWRAEVARLADTLARERHEHACVPLRAQAKHLRAERDAARKTARGIRRAVGYVTTWPFPWENEKAPAP